jgi:hypothetical protein
MEIRGESQAAALARELHGPWLTQRVAKFASLKNCVALSVIEQYLFEQKTAVRLEFDATNSRG